MECRSRDVRKIKLSENALNIFTNGFDNKVSIDVRQESVRNENILVDRKSKGRVIKGVRYLKTNVKLWPFLESPACDEFMTSTLF